MKRNIAFLFLMVFAINLSAQNKERIRGNRDVIVTQTMLEDFSTLEIGEDFKVTLVKGNEPMIEIETDSNLQEVFQKDVVNNTFSLSTSKDIRRSKKMRIRITFTKNLNKIIVKEDAVIEGLTSFSISNLEIETRNNASVFATITAQSFKLKNNNKSKVELNLTADQAVFQLNQSSNIKALVTAKEFVTDLYESATARIEGDVTYFTLRADNSAQFTGQQLSSEEAVVIAEGRSETSLHTKKKLDLSASGNSKVSVYGNPSFTINQFTDEATLYKKK